MFCNLWNITKHYKRLQMNPPPELHPALQRIAVLRDAGHSLRAMADILEAEAVPPIGRAKGWNHVRVQAALQQLEAWEAEQAAKKPAPPPPPAAPAPQQPPARVGPADTSSKMDVTIQGAWLKHDGLLWEFLLHQVWDKLEAERAHTLPLREAVGGLRGRSQRRDRATLCAALDRLARSCVIIQGAGGGRLVNITTALISSATTEAALHFQFPDPLLKVVKIPQQYVQLQELLAAKS